jgi:hypothetical protein
LFFFSHLDRIKKKMNGATLLSATVVTHNKVIINDNKLTNESNDDETESESDDDYYNEICDESSNLSKISNRDKSSEQVNIFVS